MTDFKSVGNQFITHFYDKLQNDRAGLAQLYTEDSMLTYEGEEMKGLQAIGEKIQGLPNLSYDPNGAVVDIQPSINDGIFVFINGSLIIDGNASQPLKFTQTFLLQTGGGAGYYIHNEVFRLSLG